MTNKSKYKRIALDFWNNAYFEPQYPRDIERAVLRALPLGIVKIPKLSSASANEFLAIRNLPARVDDLETHLHGCVIAFRGVGLLLVDGLDNPAEQRFSIAHETAHFILHYMLPRKQAIKKLGPFIVDVLDGVRPMSTVERIDAVISDVQIGVHSHILPGRTSDFSQWELNAVEFGADLLALELLAPHTLILSKVDRHSRSKGKEDISRLVEDLLVNRFGLPKGVAKAAVCIYLGSAKESFSIEEWLK
jgi:hypothetical protein